MYINITIDSRVYDIKNNTQHIFNTLFTIIKITPNSSMIVSCFYFVFGIVTPHTRCRLKLLKLERIKDFLLMEEELIQNQEILKPQEQKNEVCCFNAKP